MATAMPPHPMAMQNNPHGSVGMPYGNTLRSSEVSAPTTHHANEDASATRLRKLSRFFCLISPLTLFANCLYAPCFHWLSRAGNPADTEANTNVDAAKKLASLRRLTRLTALVALALAVFGSVNFVRSIHWVAHHGKHQHCAFHDRSECNECVDFVAENVVEWKGKGKGHHHHHDRALEATFSRGHDNHDSNSQSGEHSKRPCHHKKSGKGKDRKGKGKGRDEDERQLHEYDFEYERTAQDEDEDCYEAEVPDTEAEVPPSAARLPAETNLNRVYDDSWDTESDDDDDDDDHHAHRSHPVAWPRGSRQACVAGDGPLNYHKGKGKGDDDDDDDWFRRRGLLQHDAWSAAGSNVPPVRMLQTDSTVTTTTTYLAPCHKELLDNNDLTGDDTYFFDLDDDGEEDTVDQLQCPFYGAWGEDVVKDQLRHHHHGRGNRVELMFNCRPDEDCEEICDCLGGHIVGPPLFVKILIVIASALLALTTLFLALPSLYRHHRTLSAQLQRVSSSRTGHNDVVIVNGIAMSRHQASNYQNAANGAPSAFHGREMVQQPSAPYFVHYGGYVVPAGFPTFPTAAHAPAKSPEVQLPNTPHGNMYFALGSPVPTPTHNYAAAQGQDMISVPSSSSKVSPEAAYQPSHGVVMGGPVPSAPILYPNLPGTDGEENRILTPKSTSS